MKEKKNEENDVVERRKVDLSIYNVGEEYAQAFQDLMRRFMGNSGSKAFEQLIEKYATSKLIDQLCMRIDELEQRIIGMEGKSRDVVKTFRGEVK
jgi:hypothetical protein